MQNIGELLLKQTGNRATNSYITKIVRRSYETNHLTKPAVTVTKRLHSPYQLVYEIRLSLLQQAFKKTISYRGGGRNLNLSEHAEQCNVSVTYS